MYSRLLGRQSDSLGHLGAFQTRHFGRVIVVSELIDQLSLTIAGLKLDFETMSSQRRVARQRLFQTSSFSQASLAPNSVLIRHVFFQSSADQM